MVPVTAAPLQAVFLPEGDVIGVGGVDGAGLYVSESLPGSTSPNNFYQHGDGALSVVDAIDGLTVAGNRLAILATTADDAHVLALFESRRGVRWSVRVDAATRALVFPTRVVTLREVAGSIEAYDVRSGRWLWGRPISDWLPGARGRLHQVADALYLELATLTPDGRTAQHRLLQIDPGNGQVLRALDLLAADLSDQQSVVTLRLAENSDLWVYADHVSLGNNQSELWARRYDAAGSVVAGRAVYAASGVLDRWVVSDTVPDSDVLAIARNTHTDARLLAIAGGYGQLLWTEALGDRPSRVWTTAEHVVIQAPGGSISEARLRGWRAADGIPEWSRTVNASGRTVWPGTSLGVRIALPVSRPGYQKVLFIEPATGSQIDFGDTAVVRFAANDAPWWSIGSRLVNAYLVNVPASAVNLSARAVDAASGLQAWSLQQTLPVAPGFEVAATSTLQRGVRGDRAWMQLAPPIVMGIPGEVHTVVLDTLAGQIQRLVTRQTSGTYSAQIGPEDRLYLYNMAGCPGAPEAPRAVEAIAPDGSRLWCRPVSTDPNLAHPVLVGALTPGVVLSRPVAGGTGQQLALLRAADGQEAWSLPLPWTLARSQFPLHAGDRLLFRNLPFSNTPVIDGEVDLNSGQVRWQSPFAPDHGGAGSAATTLLATGDWVRAVHGASPSAYLKLQSHDASGNLRWQAQRLPAHAQSVSARRVLATQDGRVRLEWLQQGNGFAARMLADLDASSGAWLGERVLDVVDTATPLGRATLGRTVDTRPGGGTTVELAGPGWQGRTDIYLQGWPEWPASAPGNLVLADAPSAEAQVRGLGRQARVRLALANQGSGMAQVRLLAAAFDPVSLSLLSCSIPGGNCIALQGNDELPASVQIPAGGAGEIEILLTRRTGESSTVGSLHFLVAGGTELLETTLDDNQLTVAYRLGPFASGFE